MGEEFYSPSSEPKGINPNLNTQFTPSPKPPIPKMKKIHTRLHTISMENRKLAERYQNTTISDLTRD